MQADFRRVRDVFGRTAVKFKVPRYQRGFEWEEKHFEDLWVDTMRVGDGIDKHYLGNIILLEKGVDDARQYEIVDGQQRMVTISTLMMAIRDSEWDYEDDRVIEDILDTFPEGERERKLYLHEDDQDEAFVELWRGEVNDPKERVGEAYEFFRKKISEMDERDEVEEVKSKVANRLEVVETISNDSSLAYMVFQSQNERGKEVEPHILAKARIFGEADGLDDEEEKREVKGRWQEMYRKLEDELDTPRFREQYRVRRPLSQILVTSENPTPAKIDPGSLYRNFDQTLQNSRDVLGFVEWFDNKVDDYLELASSKYEVSSRQLPSEAVRELKYINSVSTHAEILTLSILDNTEDQDLLAYYFNLASTLGMRMQLGNPATRDKRDAIYSTAREVRESDNIRETLREAVNNKTPTDTEIIEHLKANPVTTIGEWGFRPTLYLASIEEERRTAPLRVDIGDLHLEHIAPRRTFKDSSRYSEWQRDLSSVDAEEFDEYKNLLGNLTLLSPEDHGSLDESSFRRKKNTYQNSDMRVTEELGDYEEWSIEKIEERTERLARELAEKWSV